MYKEKIAQEVQYSHIFNYKREYFPEVSRSRTQKSEATTN